MEKLVDDAKKIREETRTNEAHEVHDYEAFVENGNHAIKSHMTSVLSKTDAKVETAKDLKATEQDLKATKKELERLAKFDEDTHKDCDYLLKNFNLRQQARSEELESLKQSKSILSGAAAEAA